MCKYKYILLVTSQFCDQHILNTNKYINNKKLINLCTVHKYYYYICDEAEHTCTCASNYAHRHTHILTCIWDYAYSHAHTYTWEAAPSFYIYRVS